MRTMRPKAVEHDRVILTAFTLRSGRGLLEKVRHERRVKIREKPVRLDVEVVAPAEADPLQPGSAPSSPGF